MPTAAKLVAGILMAGLAWYVSELVKPLLPDETPTPLLSEVNALVGLIMGWRVMGSRAGDGYRAALGYGLTAVAATVFWCLVIWAGREMTIRSTRLRYDGPMEGITDFFALCVQYGALLGDQTVLITMAVGGLVVGLASEWASRRWA